MIFKHIDIIDNTIFSAVFICWHIICCVLFKQKLIEGARQDECSAKIIKKI
jgi:hypothetical protein